MLFLKNNEKLLSSNLGLPKREINVEVYSDQAKVNPYQHPFYHSMFYRMSSNPQPLLDNGTARVIIIPS